MIRSGDWVMKAEAHGAVKVVTGTQPGLHTKEGFLLEVMPKLRPG